MDCVRIVEVRCFDVMMSGEDAERGGMEGERYLQAVDYLYPVKAKKSTFTAIAMTV